MSSSETTLGLDDDTATTAVHAMVHEAVASCEVIDVHTHLLPPEHGKLMLWGIDELLTYHYLVAEFFQTAPLSLSNDSFFALTKVEQADLVWQHLFLDRSPTSEACRGVCTCLAMLGLGDELQRRDLSAIRTWFSQQDPVTHAERVFELAKVKYAVMTNVPFDSSEAAQWRKQPSSRPSPSLPPSQASNTSDSTTTTMTTGGAATTAVPGTEAAAAAYSPRFRAALRVDPLLSGDWPALTAAVVAEGFEPTLEGTRAYLTQWISVMQPEYLMASTPHDFEVSDDPLAAFGNGCGCFTAAAAAAPPLTSSAATGTEAGGAAATNLNTVGAFGVPPLGQRRLKNQPHRAATCAAGNAMLGATPTAAELLEKVLLPVAEKCNLAVAIKIGAVRGMQPSLRGGGDGVTTADMADLQRLLVRYPQIKWLATFLSRTNQHEACVLANKFRNLHLYGCWWYCNNPSIIREITAMRHEMLGSAFTAQHSDCRVLEQLLYKWRHARSIIADVVAADYVKLVQSGWRPSRKEVERDVTRLLGGAYEEFLAK